MPSQTYHTFYSPTILKREKRGHLEQLQDLGPGEACVISYSAKTPFSAWIAVQRNRLGKPFLWNRHSDGQYEVSVEGSKSEKDEAAPTQPQCPDHIKKIDWSRGRLSEADLKGVIAALDAYRYSPRVGNEGALIAKTALALGCHRQQVFFHIDRMRKSPKFIPRFNDEPGWQILKQFTALVAGSSTIWLYEEMDSHLKKGRTIQYVCSAKGVQTFQRLLKRRGYELEVQRNSSQPKGYLMRLVDP